MLELLVSIVCAHGDRDMYTNVETANYINQHFVAVKADFDASPKLVAQLQQAQAVLNLAAGLPLTSFITPDGRLYFGAGYLPAEGKSSKPSFREAADEALARFANRSTVEEQSFQLELDARTGTKISVAFLSAVDAEQPAAVCHR
jgi:uncharacterized protein YyaL (SSP411 family)